MGMISQLLAAYTGNDFMRELKDVLILIFGAAGALCTLYAIYIGYLFATASDEAKRRTAKNRFIKILSTALIIVALAFVMGGMNLTFTETGGGSGSGSDDLMSGLDKYEKSSTIYNEKIGKKTVAPGKTISFEIDPSNIYNTDTKASISGAKFKSFVLVGISSELKNVLDDTDAVKVDTKGKLTYTHRFPTYSNDDAKNVVINYYKEAQKDDGKKYWKGMAEFEKDGASFTVAVYIEIDVSKFMPAEDPLGSFQLTK